MSAHKLPFGDALSDGARMCPHGGNFGDAVSGMPLHALNHIAGEAFVVGFGIRQRGATPNGVGVEAGDADRAAQSPRVQAQGSAGTTYFSPSGRVLSFRPSLPCPRLVSEIVQSKKRRFIPD